MKLLFVKSILVLFFGMFLILTSCAKKSSSSQNRAGAAGRGDVGAAATTTTLGVAKCADGSNSAGRIFDDNATGSAFRNSWTDFFSAIMAPEQLGELSGASTSTATGVNVEIKLKIVNNQLNISETKLAISVRDGLVNQTNKETSEVINEIKMNFPSAESGNISNVTTAGAGNFTLVFADSYGKITVTGSYNQTVATGTVSFVNTKHYDNQTPKSGNLGKFSLNSCGLFN